MSLALLCLSLCLFDRTLPIAAHAQSSGSPIVWRTTPDGFAVASYDLPSSVSVVRSQVLLAKFSPARFRFVAVHAPDTGIARDNVRTLASSINGIAAINANFFDENGRALGVVLNGGVQKNPMHRGGKVLTGILYQRGDRLGIVHRTELPADVGMALQAGPRLVVDGKAVNVDSPHVSSRRSGVALTKSNEVILFATTLRFPGASFAEIQSLLLRPELEVVNALNFDGGGSSQMFLRSGDKDGSDLLVSGGDIVPVALVVVSKGVKK
ncbi:MAG: phosphodiester glycosidase family protein [Deltaproteobacteria bacterium]|nr:phosphodiester glycosidase family protein [Deltaproteobacteria bacterium]